MSSSGNQINPENFGAFSTITSTVTNVAVATNGVITGVGAGTTTLQVVFNTAGKSFTNFFVTVTVRAPGYANNFTTHKLHLVNGVTGTHLPGWSL